MPTSLLVLRAILTFVFVPSGLGKIVGIKPIRANFERWGLSPRIRVFIGLCELAGAAGLWIRPFTLLANLGLALLMGGAIRTHLKAEDPIPFTALAVGTTLLLLIHAYLAWMTIA